MSESLISVIAENVLGKLGSLAYDEVCLAYGVKKDIQKLAGTLTTIKTVLSDAEEQQGQNQKLGLWLEKLKNVCYDAEDVLDEFEIQVLRKQVVNRGSITEKVRHFFSCSNPLAFRFMMGHKIKEIKERLGEIAVEKENFNLINKIDNKNATFREREIYSFVHASDIIGRDKEKEEIIEQLMKPKVGENISVISIVGIGGLGKSALAKLVYNDGRIKNYFELRMWVCVPEDLDLKQSIVKILESTTSISYSTWGVEQLINKLGENLSGRKYLLILDDVWNEMREKWIKLKTLLITGAHGSKIIVTTRSNRVATIMDAVPIYNLRGLSHDECLSLFIQCAFREGQEKQYPNLIRIGEEIVKKCGGIPLAVRTLGGLLYSSTNEQEWQNVRENEIWKLEEKENGILHALRLSYNHLPPHLKQCFAYCSVFPKTFIFDSKFLIQFWIAHGLIKSSNENEELESIGNRYLNELMLRCFFQDFEDFFIYYKFKMHDLMHELATSLMKNECIIVKSSSQVCPEIRHLAFDYVDTTEIDFPGFSFDSCHARTIIFPVNNQGPSQSFLRSLISNCLFLRLLELDSCNIKVLPKEVGNLKHMRYLSVSGNLKLKKLPNSICKLQRLQTLKVLECVELEELPRDIRCLISLRTLWVTTKQKYFPKSGIGSLNSLRELEIGNCENLDHLFEDINHLKALQSLSIGYNPSLMSLPRGVKYLCSLECLGLADCEKLNLNLSMESESEDNHRDLKCTRPHLRKLLLRNLPLLVELPQWLLEASANTLQRLMIEDCPNFKALPEPMQNLESLQDLLIWNCPELLYFPKDMNCLTALRQLSIVGCPALIKRCERGIGEDWSKISHVPTIQLDNETIISSNS